MAILNPQPNRLWLHGLPEPMLEDGKGNDRREKRDEADQCLQEDPEPGQGHRWLV
jgi:hypothetical protein